MKTININKCATIIALERMWRILSCSYATRDIIMVNSYPMCLLLTVNDGIQHLLLVKLWTRWRNPWLLVKAVWSKGEGTERYYPEVRRRFHLQSSFPLGDSPVLELSKSEQLMGLPITKAAVILEQKYGLQLNKDTSDLLRRQRMNTNSGPEEKKTVVVLNLCCLLDTTI